jgi:predicted TIM-barrel fold metal-dependent hydrolase
MQLVSVDDHLIEHPRVWLDRLPRRFADRAPRVIEAVEAGRDQAGKAYSKGSEIWLYDGKLYAQLGLNAVAGKPFELRNADPIRYDEMRAGCFDPVERVKDMDEEGVEVALCFPSFPRFAGTAFQTGDDQALAVECVKAWNDFAIDEWHGTAPHRFIPLTLSPYWDIPAAVIEVERTAARGARAISFPENPVPLGLPSFYTEHWDPFLSAVEAADITLCMHFGSSGKPPVTAPEMPLAVMTTLMGCNSMYTVADLIFSTIFERHPRLKIALSEGGIGWIPYILERADFTWERQRHYQDINQSAKPSELFRKHIWGCFISDDFGIRSRHDIGIDRIAWEGDYPHSDSNWPNSRKILAESLRDVPDEEAHRMVELNARELFHFPRYESSV